MAASGVVYAETRPYVYHRATTRPELPHHGFYPMSGFPPEDRPVILRKITTVESR